MKRLSTLLVTVLLTISVFSQAPQKMSYQAVVRNSADLLVTSGSVGMQISILQGSESGTPVYVETQIATTNINGLVTIEIGGGTPVTGTFADVDWSTGVFFLKTETDPTGGSSYSITGTSQLLSVPYALHAKSAELITGEIDYNEVDPIFNVSQAANITTADISNLSNLSGTNTGDQDLRLYATKDMGNENITNLANPVADLDAVNKSYVDLLESKVNSMEDMLIDAGLYNLTDVDGNAYNVIKIGDQIWMAENLRTTKYRNGESIETTTPATLDISGEVSPKYQWAYNGDESNVTTLGRLYTWYAMSDSRNVCPSGWHVPTDSEWTILTEYLTNNGSGYQGSGSDIGKSMAAISGWRTDPTAGNVGNDQGSNNSSGFTALPGGSRWPNGNFVYIGDDGYWWCSSVYPVSAGRYMNFYSNSVSRSIGSGPIGGAGSSVRCLKDAILATDATTDATTEKATNINSSSAQLNATVNPNALSTLIIFEYGTTSSYGSTVTASQSPATGNTQTSVNANLTGLEIGTTYHYRVKAVNSLGTSYGDEVSFTTSTATAPVLTTTALISITGTTATSGGNVTDDGGSAVTARGVCWSTSENPTADLSTKTSETGTTGVFASSITGLTIGTTYYLRAYAINSVGTSYGNEVSFIAIAIGLSYQGGIVAYLLQPGDPGYNVSQAHGLIASPSDLSTGITWGNSILVTSFTSWSLGTGSSNTDLIVSSIGSGNYAANLCYDLVLGGYSDWFLPSGQELLKLYENKDIIGGFSNNFYWASTRYENNAGMANIVSFSIGVSDWAFSSSTNYVRAIRSF